LYQKTTRRLREIYLVYLKSIQKTRKITTFSPLGLQIHSKLIRSITPVATKVHEMLRTFVVLTWMRDTIESV
jgi:hypothetical protein